MQGGHAEGNLIFSPIPTAFLFNKAFLLNTQKSKHRYYNATEASNKEMQVTSRCGANISFCFLGEGGIQMRMKQSCYSLVSALTLLCAKPGTPQPAGRLEHKSTFFRSWYADFNVLLFKYGVMG